ncbi:MAG: nucleotidyltransferase domain-containing protein [Chloroflexota bacterium]|nr:nucleotidyltransferase domain-containing protein [Chloroflexota bacterium]
MSHFLLHPGASDHIRSLAAEVGAQYNAVWKELRNLEEAGLLQSETVGGRKIYRINSQFPIIPELRNILLKTVGAGDLIRESLKDLKGINEAFIFGSFAEGVPDAESDLDLMFIGNLDVAQVTPVIDELERVLARDVNYVLFTREEWKSRLENGDPFVTNVQDAPKVMLMGSQDDL